MEDTRAHLAQRLTRLIMPHLPVGLAGGWRHSRKKSMSDMRGIIHSHSERKDHVGPRKRVQGQTPEVDQRDEVDVDKDDCQEDEQCHLHIHSDEENNEDNGAERHTQARHLLFKID